MTDLEQKIAHIHLHIEGLYQVFSQDGINDHARRCLMRMFFILLDSYFKLIGKYKNDLSKNRNIDAKSKKAIEEEIRQAVADWSQYNIIRDKFSAHNQYMPMQNVVEWWNEIDYTTITRFYESLNCVRGVFVGQFKFRSWIPVDYTDLDISNSILADRGDTEFFMSLDRLAITKKNTTGIIPLSDFFDQCSLILSVIDFLFIDCAFTALTDAANTHYKDIIFKSAWRLAICDMRALIDCLYVDCNCGKSLKTLATHDWKGKIILDDGDSGRDHEFETELTCIRNKFAAHIDASDTMYEIEHLYDNFDIGKLHCYIIKHMNVFKDACAADTRTKQFIILNERLPNDVIGLAYSAHRSSLK